MTEPFAWLIVYFIVFVATWNFGLRTREYLPVGRLRKLIIGLLVFSSFMLFMSGSYLSIKWVNYSASGNLFTDSERGEQTLYFWIYNFLYLGSTGVIVWIALKKLKR